MCFVPANWDRSESEWDRPIWMVAFHFPSFSWCPLRSSPLFFNSKFQSKISFFCLENRRSLGKEIKERDRLSTLNVNNCLLFGASFKLTGREEKLRNVMDGRTVNSRAFSSRRFFKIWNRKIFPFFFFLFYFSQRPTGFNDRASLFGDTNDCRTMTTSRK